MPVDVPEVVSNVAVLAVGGLQRRLGLLPVLPACSHCDAANCNVLFNLLQSLSRTVARCPDCDSCLTVTFVNYGLAPKVSSVCDKSAFESRLTSVSTVCDVACRLDSRDLASVYFVLTEGCGYAVYSRLVSSLLFDSCLTFYAYRDACAFLCADEGFCFWVVFLCACCYCKKRTTMWFMVSLFTFMCRLTVHGWRGDTNSTLYSVLW